MRLRNKLITILLITFLVLNLIFFSFVFISRTFTDKKYISGLVNEFDIKEYIYSNQDIKESVDNYKYPMEVFNYIDDKEVKTFKNNFVDSLYGIKKMNLKKELESLFYSSVSKYDDLNVEDSNSYVKEDIELISLKFEDYVENSLYHVFNLLRFLSSNIIFYISIMLSILLCVIIIIVERGNGILISSILLFLYSFFNYYLNKSFYSVMTSILGDKKMFNYLSNYDFNLEGIYIICFILSFVLLLIYIVNFIRKKI